MRFLGKVNLVQKVLRAIVFKKRFPLVATWNITYKCNLNCGYCGVPQYHIPELGTKSVFGIIDELKKLGTKFMKFSGGEPLLRKDFPEIIDFCKSKGMDVLINSNGVIFKDKFELIKNNINEVQFSLDGERDVHDSIRGQGVHDKVIKSIELCKSYNINVFLNTVISKYNLDNIDYILNIVNKYNIGVYFQPADQLYSTHSSKDIYYSFSPWEKDYRQVMSFIISEKKKGNKNISNSLSGLRHLYKWPASSEVYCLEYLLGCLIEPDGSVFVCNMFPDYQKYLVPFTGDFKSSYKQVKLPYVCSYCYCGSEVELQLIKRMDVRALWGVWRRFSQQ